MPSDHTLATLGGRSTAPSVMLQGPGTLTGVGWSTAAFSLGPLPSDGSPGVLGGNKPRECQTGLETRPQVLTSAKAPTLCHSKPSNTLQLDASRAGRSDRHSLLIVHRAGPQTSERNALTFTYQQNYGKISLGFKDTFPC